MLSEEFSPGLAHPLVVTLREWNSVRASIVFRARSGLIGDGRPGGASSRTHYSLFDCVPGIRTFLTHVYIIIISFLPYVSMTSGYAYKSNSSSFSIVDPVVLQLIASTCCLKYFTEILQN
jgi:hypothetical protein